MKKILFALSFLLLFSALSYTPAAAEHNTLRSKPRAPRNIILFIGDGMGPEHVSAARLYQGQLLSFEQFPYRSQAITYSASSEITDSAASATAIATGSKVNNGVISLALPGNGTELETLLEYFSSQGKDTGLVSTAFITHATPAAFAAHEPSRSNYNEIAADYLEQTLPELILGGGGFGMSAAAAEDAGYLVVDDRASMLRLDLDLVDLLSGQFGTGHMPYEFNGLQDLPHLSEMAITAVDFLSRNQDQGFFLVVEGARIDHAAHSNQIEENVLETVEFSMAVERIHSWAAPRTDTLIIVTADHETGGLQVIEDQGPGEFPLVSWSTDYHTASPVPVYAWGYGSEAASDVQDNTDIYHLIKNAGSIYQTNRRTPCDFNGDGLSDYAVIRRNLVSGEAHLYIRYSELDGTASDFTQTLAFGDSRIDSFFQTDFDGDTLTDLGVFRPEGSGPMLWHIRQSSSLEIHSAIWGTAGDIPVPTDIDGDGRGDQTVFRPADGSWWSLRTMLGPIQLNWGMPGDLPVSDDFDRDGWDDIAVWRPSTGYWAVLQSTRAASTALEDIIWQQWGLPDDHPMPGDFDADNKADLVVWRPGNGTWYLCSSINRFNCREGRAVQFGLPGDWPVRSDFDGDGILDFVVWRPANGMWYVKRSSDQLHTQVQWGLPGDIPLCRGVKQQ